MHIVLGRLSLGTVVCDGNVYCGACWDVQPPLGPVEPFPYVDESFYDAVGFAPVALEYWADSKTAGATLLFPVWPVWCGLVVLSMRMFVLWQRRRTQILAQRCALCSYDLTGNVSGRCPECGTHIPASTPDPTPK